MAPRLPGATPEEFARHWRTAHAEAAGGIPGLRGYVQNHAVLVRGAPLLPYPGFDACSELSFDDVPSMDAGFASEHYQTTVRDDEGRFVDKSRFSWALTRPEVVLDRGRPAEHVKILTFWRAHPARTEALPAAADGWAEAVAQDPAVLRHERLVVAVDEHAGRDPAACELIDVLHVDGVDAALAFLAGAAAALAAWRMAGAAFGAAHLVARPRVVV
jgi:uncharacterized protein (TIGR02118 family)